MPQAPISDIIEMPYSGNGLHPTQKPVAALLPLIESFSREGGLVLDPFCGSGSTLVAAHQLNRRYLGIELDPKYYEIASQRLRINNTAHPSARLAFCPSQNPDASRPQPLISGAPMIL